MRLMELNRGCAVRDVAKPGRLMRATQIQGGEEGERKRAHKGPGITPRVVGSVLRTDLGSGRAVCDVGMGGGVGVGESLRTLRESAVLLRTFQLGLARLT